MRCPDEFAFVLRSVYRGYYTLARRFEFNFRVAQVMFPPRKIKFISLCVIFLLLDRQHSLTTFSVEKRGMTESICPH